MKYTTNTNCVACGGTNLRLAIDLGHQPLANSYLKHISDHEEKYPLRVNFCKDCTHLQLAHNVNADLLFKNYLYVSGTSKTGHKYFKDFVDVTKQYVPNANTVLDIACNDGTQLDYFLDRGYKTYGIDPAENLLQLSTRKHQVVCDYLTNKSIAEFNTKFDVIIAQNVLAHVKDPLQFLLDCRSQLSSGGRIFVQTSQANMVYNGEFDTIYHEHFSFFSVKSMKALAKRADLIVVDIQKPSIHGTSYLFVLGMDGVATNQTDDYPLDEFTIDLWQEEIVDNIEKFHRNVQWCIKHGLTVVGYGAAAKGNTLLNASNTKLHWIVDDNPLKQGLYTPGQHILIRDVKTLKDIDKLVVVPLAWNFFSEIKQRVLDINPNATFLKCYE